MATLLSPYDRSEEALERRARLSHPTPLRDVARRIVAKATGAVYWMDGSHWRTMANWNAYTSPLVGWKVSEGTTFIDPTWESARSNARSRDKVFVGYHFFRNAGASEAQYFLSHFPPVRGCMPAVDYEAAEVTPAQADIFINTVANAWEKLGIRMWFYGHSRAVGVPRQTQWARCLYWGPTYGSNLSLPPSWTQASSWQFTDGIVGPTPHSLPGVGSTSDVSRLYLTVPTLRTYAGLGMPVPPPSPPPVASSDTASILIGV